MNKEEANEFLSRHRATTSKQDKKDRHMSTMRDARQKNLYANPCPPIPDAKARIAEAIAQAEQTQRNIDALDNEGEEEC
jgi:phosphatidylethanolamine-binding protein (PEBP) family uncharacterized protein